MSFALPQSDWVRYLDEVPGGGVAAVLQRNLDHATHDTMRLYGECRIVTDHRNDDPAWTKVIL